MNKICQDKTIIIIGAGIAGVTAATQLGMQGYNVILLEARSDVGGRARMTHKVPLGPLFIHEAGAYAMEGGIEHYLKAHPEYLLTVADLPDQQPIPKILEEYAISSWEVWSHEESEGNIIVVGEQSKDFDLKKFNSIFSHYRDLSVDYFTTLSNQTDHSLEDCFAKYLLNTSEEAYSGLSLEELKEVMKHKTQKQLDFFTYGATHRIVALNGYYNLIKSMQKKLQNTKIYFDQSVTKLELIWDKVRVTTLKGEHFEADGLISTLPLGVLKNHNIEIVQLSEQKKAAIQHLKMGIMNTVILKFPTQFWTNDNFNFIVINTNPGERAITLLLNLNKIANDLEPTLMVSFFANDGLRDKHVLIQEAKAAIKNAWPGSPEPIFEFATAWETDPYTYGSYASFSKQTDHQDIVNLMRPEWNGKLIFAGDAIVPIGLMGCFHGAYISGKRAARLIDEFLSSRLSGC